MTQTIQTNTEALALINEGMQKIVFRLSLPVAVRTLMSILDEMYPLKSSDELYEMILFKTNPSLGFPKSDISKIHFVSHGEEVRVEVTLNFLSIFGAASPLPIHYSEKVLEDAQNEKILLDFLDMLNHRLKKLIYPIWEKQRYYMQYRSDFKDKFSKYILSILGLHSQAQMDNHHLDLHKLLPFSGILSMHQKSKDSMVTILRHYFENEKIYIEEGVISKSKFPPSQQVRLGEANSQIGMNMSIGSFILTRNLKFRIHFEDVSWASLSDFIEKGKKIEALKSLMKIIQKTPLSYDVVVKIKKEEIKPCALGKGTSLGINGWMGEIKEDAQIIVATV